MKNIESGGEVNKHISYRYHFMAGQVVELADTQRSGRCERKLVGVRLSSCPYTLFKLIRRISKK
ncbi:MAG: hypothetical protein G01um101466_521 [Parcubacteria group bacterium Gr01-1014_66]|nr:MAG: hypothetical protein G01um101466_521 [Parcubacteria group bacterium Gr01-1014_66]